MNFLTNEDFFAVFRTRLTNVLVDARANIKQQTWTVWPFQELIFSVCMCVTKKWADHITQGRPTKPTGLCTFKTARSEMPDNISCFGFDDVYQKGREVHRFDLLERGFQSATERNPSHTSVSTVHAPCRRISWRTLKRSDSRRSWRVEKATESGKRQGR